MTFVWRKKYTVFSVGVALLIFLGLGVGLWYSRSACDGVMPYVPERDREVIIKLFKDNWYWLIPEETPFSVEHFLDHKTPDQFGEEEGISSIYVYCQDHKTIGMISFYPMSFYKARLHFIVLDKAYRGRGISDKLLTFALRMMKEQEFTTVELITRVDNVSAQKLYERFGFKEFFRDSRFVRYEKELV